MLKGKDSTEGENKAVPFLGETEELVESRMGLSQGRTDLLMFCFQNGLQGNFHLFVYLSVHPPSHHLVRTQLHCSSPQVISGGSERPYLKGSAVWWERWREK